MSILAKDIIRKIIDGGDIIKKCSQNRVLYYYLKNFQKNERLLDIGERKIKKLKKTLIFIKNSLDKEVDYLVVKTYKFIPYVTFDVDILVKSSSFNRTKLIFKRKGCVIEKHPGKQTLKQANCKKKNLLNIDIHTGFSWQGNEYFNEDLIWKSPKKIKMENVEIKIPSPKFEFLLNAAHVLYERRYITILDFLLFYELSKNLKIKEVIKQAEEYKWSDSLIDLLTLLNGLSVVLLNRKMFVSVPIKQIKKLTFPYFLPMKFVLNIFWERYKKERYLPKFDFFYYFYTLLRYYMTGKKRLPFYIDWYKR